MRRAEYPRPQFVRQDWMCLNGEWAFAFDDEDQGLLERWEKGALPGARPIQVPFAFQAPFSGIADGGFHDVFWYERRFLLPEAWQGRRVLLHFGAVDYQCQVFVNGEMAGEHTGGSVGFTLDITRLLCSGENRLHCRVWDPSQEETIPRGKQDWLPDSHGIWYTRTSGIWQSVWLEPVEDAHIASLRFTPDLDQGSVQMELRFAGDIRGAQCNVHIRFGESRVCGDRMELQGSRLSRSMDLFGEHIFRTDFHSEGWCWSPEHPQLFDVTLELWQKGKLCDRVESYFGMRKIHTKDGVVYLNNRPYYQKLVLDQGYWPEGLLTAPSDEAFRRDIELSKEMGFNGCRKHQKVEDPRFLYWADKLGFLVWGEIPSAPSFSHEAVARLTEEFLAEVERDYNHPCIVAWVPMNESWGVPYIRENPRQQSHSLGLYHTVRAVDGTRLVVSNDGWEQTVTDLCAIHNYRHGEKNEPEIQEHFRQSLSHRSAILSEQPAGRPIYANGFAHRGEPILLTEFGGIGFRTGAQRGWGYSSVENAEEYLEEYARVLDAVRDSHVLAGFCYTQLCDVEQEINGLLTYDRKPKAPLHEIHAINERWRQPVEAQEP